MFEAENLMIKQAKYFEEVFGVAVENTRENIDINELEKNISNYYEEIEVLNILKKSLSHFKPIILNSVSLAAKQESKFVLDLESHQSLNAVNKICNHLITDITEQQRNVFKNIISSGVNRGLSNKVISEKIKSNIGLNQVQVTALQAIEDNLKFENISPEKINKIIENKSKQMLKARSQTIAITESARAVSEGRYLIQQQTFDNDEFPSDVLQEWLTGSDERTCSVCAPMNGQKIKMNELFITGNGIKVKSPILHPRCRCIVRILFKGKKND